jgi:hypothetical protein
MESHYIGEVLYYKGEPIRALDVKQMTRLINTGDKFVISYVSTRLGFLKAMSTKFQNVNYEIYVLYNQPHEPTRTPTHINMFISVKEQRKLKIQNINDNRKISLYKNL